MSIFSTLVASVEKGGLSALPAAVATFIGQTKAWGEAIISKAEGNATYGALVTTAVDDAETAIQNAASWIGTAVEGDLVAFGNELAPILAKYAPILLSGASAASPGGATLLSALEDIAAAEIKALLLQLAGTANQPATDIKASVPVATSLTDTASLTA